MMELLLGLFSLAGLALFMGRVFKRSASLMPLVAVSAAMLWFTLFGMLNLLLLGGWLWYLGCGAALFWCIVREKAALLKRFTPGFMLFVAGGVFFALLFSVTRPMLTQWDEFTFWGAAAKVVKNTNQLYTVANSNLIARYAQPGLIGFTYMMQFFGRGFAEYGMMTALAVVYLAGFAAAAALWDTTRAGTLVVFAALFALPFLFEGGGVGVASFAYLSCMADTALAALFGGALCLYFAGGAKTHTLLIPFGLVLAALTNLKDIGLALAAIAWLVVLLDLVFCEYKTMAFFRLRRWKAALAYSLCSVGFIGLPFFGWNQYVLASTMQNRANVGSGGGGMSQLEMLLTGIKALLRIQPDAAFDDRLGKMMAGFFGRYEGQPSVNFRLWLFGSAARLLLVILAVLLLAWLLGGRGQKRRVLVLALAMLGSFAAFSIFLTFTYTYIFKGGESETLKDYARYSMPYWFGWLMTALLLLGNAVHAKAHTPHLICKAEGQRVESDEFLESAHLIQTEGSTCSVTSAGLKSLLAKIALLGVAVCILGGVLLRSNLAANFLRVSPSMYGKRLDVQAVVQAAKAEGMQEGDVVYLISQGDDASRFYMFGYEMDDTTLATLYRPPSEQDPWNTNGHPPKGTTAASLVAPGQGGYAEAVACTPQELLAYLKAKGCTHLLIDQADGYVKEAFGPLFADGLDGWDIDGQYQDGNRYFAIVWQQNTANFVPVQGGDG